MRFVLSRLLSQLLSLSRLIDAVNDRLGNFASWLVLLACLVSAGNALLRYTLDMSSNAWLEIQWYMFGAMFMLGAAHTLRMNAHVRVDVIYGMLSPKGKLWVDLLGTLLFLLPVTLILAWLSWPIFSNSFFVNEMSSNPGGLLRWPIKFVLPFGFAMLALQGVSEAIKRIAMLSGYLPLQIQYERPVQ